MGSLPKQERETDAEYKARLEDEKKIELEAKKFKKPEVTRKVEEPRESNQSQTER